MVEKLTDAKIPIYSYKNDSAHSFFLSLYLRAGSMYETVDESGITHFYEHISIRNVNELMNGELYELLDEYGLEFNASTYNEFVQFYITGAPRHFSFATDVLLKLLIPLVLNKADVDAERTRIKAEIREADERGSLLGYSLPLVFEGTPLSRSIAGTLGSVSKITLSRLEKFRKESFVKENMFIYATGKIGEEELSILKCAVDSYDIPSGKIKNNIAERPSSFGKRELCVNIKNADFTKVRFSFDIDMAYLSSEELDLLYDTMLSGYSSEFFIEMSEKRGFFYDVSGSLEKYKNIGTLSFSYELKGKRLYEALELTVEILHGMGEKLLPERKIMKAGYVDNAYMLLDEPRELNFTFAYDNHIMSQGYSSIEDRRLAYASVTPEAIRQAAKKLFRPENLTFTMKGNKKKIDTGRIRDILSRI